jgi:hypothetical protein
MPRPHDDALALAPSARPPHAAFATRSLKTEQQTAACRLDERNAALRAAQHLFGDGAPYRAAKELHRDLRDYLARCWPRERHLNELPAGAAERRVALHRIARLNGGRDLCWHRIYDILSDRQPSRSAERERPFPG